jgi:hypothetical protein
MLTIIKLLLLAFISFIFGFGFWYLVFWFITNEPNLFMWNWIIKLIYLIFGAAATEGIIKNTRDNIP